MVKITNAETRPAIWNDITTDLIKKQQLYLHLWQNLELDLGFHVYLGLDTNTILNNTPGKRAADCKALEHRSDGVTQSQSQQVLKQRQTKAFRKVQTEAEAAQGWSWGGNPEELFILWLSSFCSYRLWSIPERKQSYRVQKALSVL